ncbi:ABC transporter ATP-binding protein [Agrococcus sp. Marseille-Q4369]|uniref:ABC transporter ATP-binding protein n=1 Tax=Agrococcus sp. Marseille-Q4369 TaxID=2810513 RepID=UPI001B8D9296|nr:ABC transporter ATP-binding protein [Agrococcus sp. Marseille-Q4369]QUW17966.1 ABC transporter ATP-binding protein [Agrococcus sp. Marseille-Q4369]
MSDPLNDGRLNDGPVQPTRKQQLKPFEYLAFAGAAGLFIGLIVFMTVRDVVLALIFGGVGFILTLLLTATLMLAVKPKGRSSADLDKRDGFEA